MNPTTQTEKVQDSAALLQHGSGGQTVEVDYDVFYNPPLSLHPYPREFDDSFTD